ncbi:MULTISPECIES: hypothetical protein [unclassified Enterococcus]|uniref:hypothetical protein n=1 Tax=unclassified Enterococcus TaxID=2608891 RepID=UPI0013EA4B57|nr:MULTISPECIES: hypothetical protein [unclassified Enterococcus]
MPEDFRRQSQQGDYETLQRLKETAEEQRQQQQFYENAPQEIKDILDLREKCSSAQNDIDKYHNKIQSIRQETPKESEWRNKLSDAESKLNTAQKKLEKLEKIEIYKDPKKVEIYEKIQQLEARNSSLETKNKSLWEKYKENKVKLTELEKKYSPYDKLIEKTFEFQEKISNNKKKIEKIEKKNPIIRFFKRSELSVLKKQNTHLNNMIQANENKLKTPEHTELLTEKNKRSEIVSEIQAQQNVNAQTITRNRTRISQKRDTLSAMIIDTKSRKPKENSIGSQSPTPSLNNRPLPRSNSNSHNTRL